MRQLKIQDRITDRRDKSLDRYIAELSGKEYQPLTVEEEVECSTLILENKDPKALERLVKANLRFVVSVAKQYNNFEKITLMDLINEGNVGLIKAAERFDHKRGFKFISYAVWWIRQAILGFLNDHSRIVKLPLNKIQALSNIGKIERQLEQDLGRQPSKEEIEALFIQTDYAIKNSIKDIDEHMSIDKKSLSLDYNMSTDNGAEEFTLLDLLSTDQDVEEPMSHTSLQIELNRYLNTLDRREKKILELFYGLNGFKPQTLDQISSNQDIELTRERVRQIREKALRKLKSRASHRDSLKQYLG